MDIPKDKQGHIFVGFVLAAGAGFIWQSYVLAFLFVSAFAIGKEIYDYFNQDNHSVEFLDIIASYVGGIFGSIAYAILNTLN